MKPIKMVGIAILTLLGLMFATTHRVAAQTASTQTTTSSGDLSRFTPSLEL
jgi:hypothetical protein